MAITIKTAAEASRAARGRPPGLRGAGLPHPTSSRRHHRRTPTSWRTTHIVNVQGAVPAPLNYRRRATSPTPSRSAPRSTIRSATASPNDKPAEERRHRQHRRHRHQGRLARRHQPHVHRRRRLDRRQAPVRSVTYEAMWRGIDARSSPGAPGRHRPRHPDLRRGQGFSVVREFCGHGIGKSSTKSRRCCTTAAPARWKNWCRA